MHIFWNLVSDMYIPHKIAIAECGVPLIGSKEARPMSLMNCLAVDVVHDAYTVGDKNLKQKKNCYLIHNKP